MAAIIKRCFICDYEYDEDQKRPLMLDCGHSFCLSCLQQIKEGGEATCPTCRRCWEEKNIEELPLCYQLLPEEPEGVAKLCTDHKSQVLFWCETCKCRLCRKCLREQHRSCDWVLLEERLDPMKEDFMQKADVIFTRLTESLDKIGKTTSENKAVLDLIRDLKKVLGPAEVLFAAYQQQILLLRVKVSRELVALENLKTDWAIPDSDFMSTLQSKTRALEEIQKVLWWPQQPNWGFLGKIVDNFQQNRTRELTLAEICEGAALPLSDDEDGQNDDNAVEEEVEQNEEQQQVDEDDEEEDGGSSVRENPAAATAATATSNAVQTNDSAGASGYPFTPENAAGIFSTGARLVTESATITSADESNASSSFSFGTISQGDFLAIQGSSRFLFGSASPGTPTPSSQTPMSVTQQNMAQAPVFSVRRATQALATPSSLYVFRRTLRPSENTVPSSTAFSFGTVPPPPPTTVPMASAFSFGTAPQPTETTDSTSSASSFGTAPQPTETTDSTSSASSFGTAPQSSETTALTRTDFSFGTVSLPQERTVPTSSAFLFRTAPQLPETTALTRTDFSFGTVSLLQEITVPTRSSFLFETVPQPIETTVPSSSAFSFGTASQLSEPTAPTSSTFSFGTAPQPPETTTLSSSTATQPFSASVSFPATSVAPAVRAFRFTAIGHVPTTDAATITGAHVITASTQTVTAAPTTTRRVLAAAVQTTRSPAGASTTASFPVTSTTTPEPSATACAVPRTTTATSSLPSVAASTAGFSPRELFSLAASGINTVTLVTPPSLQTTETVDNAQPARDAVPSRSSSAFVFSSAPVFQSSTPTTQISVLNSQMISTAIQTTAAGIQTTPANPTATRLVTATGAFVATTQGTTPSSQTSGSTSTTGPESILPTEPMDVVQQVNDTNNNNSAQARPATARNPTVEVYQLSNGVDSNMGSVSAVGNVSEQFDLTDAVADALRQLPEKPPSSIMTLAAFQFAEGIRQEMPRTETGEPRKADSAYRNEELDASASVVDALEQLKKLQKIHRSPTFGSSVSGGVFSSSGTANVAGVGAQEPGRYSEMAAAMLAPEVEVCATDAAFGYGLRNMFEAAGDSAAMPTEEAATAVRTDAVSMSAASENIRALYQAGVEAAITVTGGSEAAGSTAGGGGSQGATPLNDDFNIRSPGAAASVRPKQPVPQATDGASTSSQFGESFPISSLLLGTVQSTTTEGDNLHQAEPRVTLRRGGPFLKRPLRMRRKPRDKS